MFSDEYCRSYQVTLLKIKVSRLTSDLLNQKLWERRLVSLIVMRSPGDANPCGFEEYVPWQWSPRGKKWVYLPLRNYVVHLVFSTHWRINRDSWNWFHNVYYMVVMKLAKSTSIYFVKFVSPYSLRTTGWILFHRFWSYCLNVMLLDHVILCKPLSCLCFPPDRTIKVEVYDWDRDGR